MLGACWRDGQKHFKMQSGRLCSNARGVGLGRKPSQKGFALFELFYLLKPTVCACAKSVQVR